ncbi:MAG: hypothetical protein NTZ09_18035, partial [Candidatus Hydrogenedentes bacterium]|nr:hypothetical protein [Candidatus Hydrogenedentota bacterium]
MYFFVYTYALETVDLWRTDGSLGGTHRVYSITPSYSATELVSMGGNLYFLSSYYGGAKLWKVVPDTAQVTLLETLPVTTGSIKTPFAAGNALYFILNDRLYRTDGTPGGAVSIEVGQWQWCRFLCALGNRAVYILERESYRYDLYCSDGTPDGTAFLGSFQNDFFACDDRVSIAMKENVPATIPHNEPPLNNTVNGVLYFSTMSYPAMTQGLWKTDGTPGGTTLVKEGMVPMIRSGNGGVFFVDMACEGGPCLWFTDGTEEATVNLHSVFFEGNGIGGFHVVNGLACFLVGDFASCELWRSDGTVEGTVKLKDIGPYLSAAPVVVGDKLLFECFDPETALIGLWRTDGTTAGTLLLTELA